MNKLTIQFSKASGVLYRHRTHEVVHRIHAACNKTMMSFCLSVSFSFSFLLIMHHNISSPLLPRAQNSGPPTGWPLHWSWTRALHTVAVALECICCFLLLLLFSLPESTGMPLQGWPAARLLPARPNILSQALVLLGLH